MRGVGVEYGNFVAGWGLLIKRVIVLFNSSLKIVPFWKLRLIFEFRMKVSIFKERKSSNRDSLKFIHSQ